MSKPEILVIEDNSLARKVMASQLAGYHVDFVETLTAAKERLEESRYDLCQLIHDVNSQCGSLKSAAGLLKNASPKEAHELLELMIKQAQVLHQKIASYEELLGRQ